MQAALFHIHTIARTRTSLRGVGMSSQRLSMTGGVAKSAGPMTLATRYGAR